MVCRLLLIAAALLVAVGAAPQIQTPYNRGIISTAVNPSRYAYTSPVVSSYPGAAYETYETGPAIYASAGPAIRPAVYASSAPAQIRPAVYASSAPAQISPAVYATSAPAQIRPAVYSTAPRPVIPQGAANIDVNYDPNPQYSFSYSINDPETGDAKSHEESRNGDSVQGSYSLIESDGTRRIVEYTADAVSGFNAVVHREAGAAPPPPAPVRPYAAAQAPIVQRAPVPTPTVAYQPAPAIAYKSAPSLAYRTAPTVAYQTVPEVSYQSVPALGYNVAARQPLITSSATHPGSVQTSYTGPFGNYAY